MIPHDFTSWTSKALADYAGAVAAGLSQSDPSRSPAHYEAVRDALANRLAQDRREAECYRPDPDQIADQLEITLDRVGRIRTALAQAVAECADLNWVDGTAIPDAPGVYMVPLVHTLNALTDLDRALALAESAATRGKHAAEAMSLRRRP